MITKRFVTASMFAALICVLFIPSCAILHKAPVHPGSVSALDSDTYDTLKAAKNIIDISREQFDKGLLSPTLKPAVNQIVSAYNSAMPLYKEWHEAAAAGKATDAQLNQITAALLVVNKAVEEYKRAK